MFKYFSLAVVLGAACYVQAVAVEAPSNALCKSRNSYYPIQGECDGYIECKDYQANEMLCPDGLHFNPRAIFPDYPCSYPSEMSCEGRGAPQPAKPTAECPHQYGFFVSPSARPDSCGQYLMCVDGQAMEMMCPAGLAFNPETTRCDWPDQVPSCKAEEYLRFQCPAAPFGEDGQPIEVVNYEYDGDCYAFFSCEHGRPRLLTCDAGYAFDAGLGRCVDAEKARCARALL